MRGEGYSLADIAAATGNGNNGNGSFGGDYGAWWIIIIIVLFGWGRNGFGGNNGNGSNGGAMDGYVLASDFAQVDRKLDSISNGICDSTFALNNTIVNGNNALQNTLNQGFAGLNTGLVTQGYENRIAVQGISSQLANCCCDIRQQIADCCCTTQRGIDGINYNMAMNTNALQNTLCLNTRDIIDNQNANYRALHDEIVANKLEAKNDRIAEQQNEINALRLSASQEKQNNYLTSYMDRLNPNRCPEPAYIVPNPNCCYDYTVTRNSCCNNGCY